MVKSLIARGLAALQTGAGVALLVAPFLTALGESGPPESYPGSIVDLKPAYGSLLVVAGASIACLGLVVLARARPEAAALAGLIAVVAGVSLDVVQVTNGNEIIFRSYSVFELRGTGPWTAAVACLAALAAAAVLTLLHLVADPHRGARP